MVRYKLFALAASAGCAALIAGTTQAQAQQQYNLCDIENVPASFIERLRDRPDFNAIAQRVANSCPGSLEALTGTATASVGGAAASGGGADEYNLCDIEEVPEDVRARVRGRADFDEILLQMTEVCGDSALILAEGPTASVAQGFSGRRTPEPNENIGGSLNGGGGNGGQSDESEEPAEEDDVDIDFGGDDGGDDSSGDDTSDDGDDTTDDGGDTTDDGDDTTDDGDDTTDDGDDTTDDGDDSTDDGDDTSDDGDDNNGQFGCDGCGPGNSEPNENSGVDGDGK